MDRQYDVTYLDEKLGEVDQKMLQYARRWKEAEQRAQLELWHESVIQAEETPSVTPKSEQRFTLPATHASRATNKQGTIQPQTQRTFEEEPLVRKTRQIAPALDWSSHRPQPGTPL